MKDLKLGSFLAEYYNGLNGGMTGIYRIGDCGHSDYTAFDILTQSETDYTFPCSVSYSTIAPKDEKSCMLPISFDEVNKLIVERERKELVDYLMLIPHAIGGVKNGGEREFWETTEPYEVIGAYHRRLKNQENKFELIRLFENGIKTYDPIGNFKFWGHGKIKILEIVG